MAFLTGAHEREDVSFPERVYTVVRCIPPGWVTTYGHIALLLGVPRLPRQVGQALRALPRHRAWAVPTPVQGKTDEVARPGATDESSGGESSGGRVPWHRVVNARGRVSLRSDGGIALQVALLRAEGVNVADDGVLLDGLAAVGWFPDHDEVAGTDHRSNLLFD